MVKYRVLQQNMLERFYLRLLTHAPEIYREDETPAVLCINGVALYDLNEPGVDVVRPVEIGVKRAKSAQLGPEWPGTQ